MRHHIVTKLAIAAALATMPWNLPALQLDLQLLGSFETLQTLGFTPDDVTFNPARGTLFISSAADSVVPPSTQGVYEVTQDGVLLQHLATGGTGLGFSITRATSGPNVGHFFMAEFNGTPSVRVFEFDRQFAPVNDFTVSGVASPGDGLAFNHLTRTLMLVDGGLSHLIEVSTSGEPLRLIPTPGGHVVGLTFHVPTGTYFGVDSGGTMTEFSADGIVLRHFDLTAYGVKNSVGIASGQGKLFIADEDDPPNTGGAIFIFRAPRRP